MLNGSIFAIFGGSIFTGKFLGLIAPIFAIGLTAIAMRQHGPHFIYLAAMSMAAFFLVSIPFSFLNRPDPLLTLVTVFALLILLFNSRASNLILTSFFIGFFAGLACGLKIYGIIFIIPIALFYIIEKRSFFALFIIVLTAIITFFLPFFHPIFPITNYLAWFGVLAQKSLSLETLSVTLRYSIFFLLPAIFLLALQIKRINNLRSLLLDPVFVYVGSTIFGLFVCMYLASKPGAGAYYFLPYSPIIVDIMVRIVKTNFFNEKKISLIKFSVGLLITTLFFVSIPKQKRFLKSLNWQVVREVRADLNRIDEKYNNYSIQMGVGSSLQGYQKTMLKSELVFNGHPYTVDFGVLMETSHLGIPLPEALIKNLTECSTDLWLIPAGESPFQIIGYYGNQSVDQKFRTAFLNSYKKYERTVFFDIWACKK